MRIIRPTQDTVFFCLASACPDTCCAGWEIPVDGESTVRWNDLPQPWRLRMEEAIEWVDGEHRLKQHGGRCALLNEENLCELYAACGEKALCRTCFWHPRFVEEYGNLREIMPGLSCPAWSSLYLMEDSPVEFTSEETDEPPAYNDIDGLLFFRLKKARDQAFELLRDRTYTLSERMNALLHLAEETDGTVEGDTVSAVVLPAYLEKLGSLEVLTPQWREILTRPHVEVEQPWIELVGERVLIYYVFRFWLKGVHTGKVLPWAKLAVWSWICVAALGRDCKKREDYCEVIRLYSKEIEHCEGNLQGLYRVLCRHSGRYSAAGLRKAWEEFR